MAERLPWDNKYSMKNIPIPTEMEYRKKLTGQTENVIRRMSWKAFHYLYSLEEKQNTENSMFKIGDKSLFHGDFEKPKTYGFKSERKPPFIKELQPFIEQVFKMIRNVKFRQVKNEFMKELQDDIKSLKQTDKVVVEADKSNNFYLIDKLQYNQLLEKDIHKEYKKSSENELNLVNLKAAKIAKELQLDNRMKIHTTTECYVTIKDHKDEFMSKMPCRLINPAKSEMGRVSKILVEDINLKVRDIKKLNQWKNTAAVINWFTKLENKSTLKFFKYDIQSFYPSITKELLYKAIEFARNIIYIPENDINIIMQSRENLLFHEGEIWQKKKGNFDVAMGSYDGAEICELIGLYILDKITKGRNPIFSIEDVGLYRDDGLAVVRTRGRAGGLLDNVRKRLEQAFKEEKLDITHEKGMTSTDFLDVKLNLEKDEYRPFRKPNDFPTYINVKSNHPPTIIKQIPKMIEKRLTNLSSCEKVFEETKAPYVTALKNSGHESNLKYNPEHKENKQKRKRRRNPIYYNPPYSENVQTNIAGKFLHLVKKCFPKKHPLSKIFNRSKVKVSYCTMNNMKRQISKHNAKVRQNNKNQQRNSKSCNCRIKKDCPLDGNCLIKSVVYQASVSCNNPNNVKKTYIGQTGDTFKKRFNGHKHTFKNSKANSTTLSTYIWKCKNSDSNPKIEWSIKAKAHAFSSGSRQCDLCLSEKVAILLADPNTSLNQRNEILAKCPHKRKFLLSSFKPNNPPPPIPP